jgi:hypothetical protein
MVTFIVFSSTLQQNRSGSLQLENVSNEAIDEDVTFPPDNFLAPQRTDLTWE